MQNALNAAGGLALFLFAMLLLTDGLKASAGGSLKRLLGQWTSTPERGVLAGMLITGIVQSSSAVTVAAIGFVNAGVLSLRQGLGVIYGTNVGTTMTGWLVSLVGFGFKIESFALPTLAVGVGVRFAARGKRAQGAGTALVGFALLFLGLAILKDAFSGLASAYGAAAAEGNAGHWPAYFAIGFVATVLTQSSSAAIAILLTAAAGGAVGIEAAAVAVIGANLGTTSTAAIAALKATPAARRLALAHIVFNLVTGIVALALLPLVLHGVELLAGWLALEGGPAAFLALFHTTFNVLGVAIMLPLNDTLARILERLFRSAEEDLARPQHLDATLEGTPELAAAALRQELLRMRALAAALARAALVGASAPAPVERLAAALSGLVASAAAYIGALRAEGMPRDVADDLGRALRTNRYLEEAARHAPQAQALREEAARLGAPVQSSVAPVLAAADDCARLAERPAGESGDEARAAALGEFEQAYQQAKAALLSEAVARALPVDTAGALLDGLSATRRLVEQLVKADRLMRAPHRAHEIEAAAQPAAG